MQGTAVDPAAVDAVLIASRSLIGVATQSLGTAAEETTIAQYRVLVVLASRGPQRMVDLAAALDVTPSTAGRMCDRLLRKGLIRRHRATGICRKAGWPPGTGHDRTSALNAGPFHTCPAGQSLARHQPPARPGRSAGRSGSSWSPRPRPCWPPRSPLP